MVKVDYESGDEQEIDSFVNVNEEAVDENGQFFKQSIYVPVETAGTVEGYKLQALEYVLGRLEYWTQKYEQYKELEPIAKEIKKLKANVRRRATRAAKKRA